MHLIKNIVVYLCSGVFFGSFWSGLKESEDGLQREYRLVCRVAQ